MKGIYTALLIAGLAASPASAEPRLLRTAQALSQLNEADSARRLPFRISGALTAALANGHYLFSDGTACIHVRNLTGVRAPAGASVRLDGNTSLDLSLQRQFEVTNCCVTGNGPPPEPVCASIADILAGRRDYQPVSVTGTVSDVFRDSTDAGWMFLALQDQGDTLTVALPVSPDPSRAPGTLLNARVRLTGAAMPDHANVRRYIGPHLELAEAGGIDILEPAPQDPFAVPELEDCSRRPPADIVNLGPRRLVGRVLAVWGKGNLLLAGAPPDLPGSNRLAGAPCVFHRVELLDGLQPPPCCATVEVVGRPATDIYHVNLTRARCRVLSPPEPPPRPAVPTVPAEIFRDGRGRPWINMIYHGSAVRFAGVVLAGPDDNRRALISCDGCSIPFDVSGEPRLAERLEPDSRVEFSGIGIAETDNWHVGAPFPVIKGFAVIARDLDDVTVIESAPWWTPRRRRIAFASLIALLAGLLVWIRLLNRLVEKRGRQLYREEFARSVAVLRTEDRTRLAVELHDSLSQTLTGVALQVDAIALAAEQDPERLTQYVATARRTVDNCRNELKNCLWDLRNQALDESDAAEAVRKTVSPLAGDAVVTIDFGIPRSHFSDLTFHDILRILRELVTNAVRHGNARNIAITGVDGGQAVRFTVKDDGCGFDPSARPGIADGHFGLDGIAERLRRTNGSLSIDSAPGRGTTAVFTLTRSHP